MIKILTGESYAAAVAEAIAAARKELLIIMYRWELGSTPNNPAIDTVRATLNYKLRAGLECRAIVDRESTRRYLANFGVRARTGPAGRVVHAKLLISDDGAALLGSHNLTRRAASANIELSIKITDATSVAKLKNEYQKIWQRCTD